VVGRRVLYNKSPFLNLSSSKKLVYHAYIHTYIHTYIYTYIHIYVYMCVCVCVYACVYVDMCMYICIYMHICIHILSRAVSYTYTYILCLPILCNSLLNVVSICLKYPSTRFCRSSRSMPHIDAVRKANRY
jgi:hypothetical protein